MKSGIKVLVSCGWAFGFWSIQVLAVPVVLEMKVVRVNGVDVIPTNTITIDPLDTIEVEFFASNWTPFEVFLYQIRLNGATLDNGLDSDYPRNSFALIADSPPNGTFDLKNARKFSTPD